MAVATSKKFVRIYSLGGVLLNVLQYSHLVTMVGHEQYLCVVYMTGHQSYKFAVHDMKKKKLAYKGSIPVRFIIFFATC